MDKGARHGVDVMWWRVCLLRWSRRASNGIGTADGDPKPPRVIRAWRQQSNYQSCPEQAHSV